MPQYLDKIGGLKQSTTECIHVYTSMSMHCRPFNAINKLMKRYL